MAAQFAHIDNLYKNQDIMLFRRCYALEKVHGENAWIKLKRGSPMELYAGSASLVTFSALFDLPKLQAGLESLGCEEATIFGEVFGGAVQHMSKVYGLTMDFVGYDIQIDNLWLAVPQMDELLRQFGVPVIPYVEINTDMAEIDFWRDAPSVVADHAGMGRDKPREGVVLRPLIELTKNNGERVIAKHKTKEHSERKTVQTVGDPTKLKVLADAQAIADEWVTPMRLVHVLQKLPPAITLKDAVQIIKAMQEDVTREAAGEIVVTKEALTAIGKRAIELFKARN